MANLIQRIRYQEFNSGLLRKILGWYFREDRIYTIPFGALRGFRMRYHKEINFHAILGFWETKNIEILSSVVKGLFTKPVVACDIGANIGEYALWFHRYLPAGSTIHAFEPSQQVLGYLRETIEVNKAANVEVVASACADHNGKVAFYLAGTHHRSSFNREWAASGDRTPTRVEVDAVTLDDFYFSRQRVPPDFIKIDVEGGAKAVFDGAARCIREKNPLILIESHLPDEDAAIGSVLVNNGYQAYRITNCQWVEDITATHPDPKGVWGALLLCPAGLRPRIETLLP